MEHLQYQLTRPKVITFEKMNAVASKINVPSFDQLLRLKSNKLFSWTLDRVDQCKPTC